MATKLQTKHPALALNPECHPNSRTIGQNMFRYEFELAIVHMTSRLQVLNGSPKLPKNLRISLYSYWTMSRKPYNPIPHFNTLSIQHQCAESCWEMVDVECRRHALQFQASQRSELLLLTRTPRAPRENSLHSSLLHDFTPLFDSHPASA